jgi:hypothetical protein
MSISSEIRKLEHYQVIHRSAFTRIATSVLAAAVVFSLTGLGHDGERQRSLKEAVASSVATFMPTEKTTERNETVRMPIKFDDGLRALATTGE